MASFHKLHSCKPRARNGVAPDKKRNCSGWPRVLQNEGIGSKEVKQNSWIEIRSFKIHRSQVVNEVSLEKRNTGLSYDVNEE